MSIPVLHSYGKWYLSGVNTWTVNLIRAMMDTDFDSKVLFTGIPRSQQEELEELGIPYDFLEVPKPRRRHDEWRALKDYLESKTPCIYITNFDFHRSCAVGSLSPEVRVLTVIHSDEDCYYDELRRIGQNCDAIVCVSSFLAAKVKDLFPRFTDKVHLIPYGIPISEELPPARPSSGPLRLCYCNRLQQYQKQVFDLPLVAAELERLGVAFELDIAGDGRDAEELRKRFAAANLQSPVRFHGKIPNAAVMDLYRRNHIFLLTSKFEGLPISLLEAMSVGCVPVVYEVESGIADVIPSVDVGNRIQNGNIALMSSCIKKLGENRESLAMQEVNARHIVNERFSLNSMRSSYARLFCQILESKSLSASSRTNKVMAPKTLQLAFRIKKRLQHFLPLIKKI